MAFTSSLERMWASYCQIKKKQPSLRFGQYFCNLYVKQYDAITDPLFNEHVDMVAKFKINDWLIDNQYVETMPPEVRAPSFLWTME